MENLLCEIMERILLTESASVNDVMNAMDGHRRILMSYRTKGEDKNTGPRVIEVYAYGLTKAGNPVIRAFQPYGDTTSKVPSWKFFRLDRIISWKDTGQIFDRPASDYYKDLGNFNPNGDGTMSVVYKIISFNGRELDAPLSQPVTKGGRQGEPVYRTDAEKRMARLRNQLDNPITLSDLYPNRYRKPQATPEPTPAPKPEPKANEPEIYRTDTERGMDRLRRQLNNPMTIDDLRRYNSQQSDPSKIKAVPNTPKMKDDSDKVKSMEDRFGDISQPISVADLRQRLNPQAKDGTYRTDTERGMDRLRQQLDNPTKIDLSRFQRGNGRK